MGFLCDSASKKSACNAGGLGLIPGLGRSPREGNGYPLQYSGLENSLDCIVYGVAKSWTRLSDFHFHFFTFHFTGVNCMVCEWYLNKAVEGNGILLTIAKHPRAHNRHLGGTWKILASVNIAVIFYVEATAKSCWPQSRAESGSLWYSGRGWGGSRETAALRKGSSLFFPLPCWVFVAAHELSSCSKWGLLSSCSA